MFRELTDNALECIMLAHLEAEWSGSLKVELVHVLLALLSQDDDAGKLLKESGADSERVLRKATSAMSISSNGVGICMAQETIDLLNTAKGISLKSGRSLVTSMDLLSSFLQTPSSEKKRLLEPFGISLEQLDDKVRLYLSEPRTIKSHFTQDEKKASIQRGIAAWDRRASRARQEGREDLLVRALSLKMKWSEHLEKLNDANAFHQAE